MHGYLPGVNGMQRSRRIVRQCEPLGLFTKKNRRNVTFAELPTLAAAGLVTAKWTCFPSLRLLSTNQRCSIKCQRGSSFSSRYSGVPLVCAVVRTEAAAGGSQNGDVVIRKYGFLLHFAPGNCHVGLHLLAD